MDVVVSGSSGLIGRALRSALIAAGHGVRRLVRRPPSRPDEIAWDPDHGTIDTQGLEGAGAVVHLAGESIGARRWNEDHKARVYASRVRGTRLLAETLARLDRPPGTLVGASAVGYYGDRGTEVLTEDSSPGTGFLARVCIEWEAATEPARQAGLRVACIRTGLVLSAEDGLLPRMLLPFRLGLGARLGRGDQYWSWITISDEIRAILHLLTTDVAGGVNLTSPNPVTNADFTRILGRVLGRPAALRVPAAVLRVGLGAEMARDMMLGGQRVRPTRLLESGFTFHDPDLEPALRGLLGRDAA